MAKKNAFEEAQSFFQGLGQKISRSVPNFSQAQQAARGVVNSIGKPITAQNIGARAPINWGQQVQRVQPVVQNFQQGYQQGRNRIQSFKPQNVAYKALVQPNSPIDLARRGQFTQIPQATKKSFVQGMAPYQLKSPTDVSHVLLGTIGGGQSKFAKSQIDLVRRSFSPEVRDRIGQFAVLVEKGKGRNNLGPLGDYVHTLGETVFGKKAANLTSKQLKNAFDTIMQEADRGQGIGPKFNIGLGVQDVRGGKKVAKAGIADASNMPTKARNTVDPLLDQSVPQLAEGATQKLGGQAPLSQKPSIPGGGPPNTPGDLSSGGSLPNDQDLINTLTQALKTAKPIRGQQEALYTKARGQKMAKMMSARERVAGEKGFFAEKGALKGELPKVEYEAIRQQFNQPSVDRLFDIVRQHKLLDEWDKLTAQEGLAKILGEYGGVVPTRGEIEKLYKVFGKDFTEALLSKRSLFQKMGEVGLQAYNIPRSLMAGVGDFSATLMQNLVFAYRHPIMTSRNFGKQIQMFRSEDVFRASQEEIYQRPTYKLMKEAKLALTDLSPMLGNREEQYMAPIAEKIPLGGGKLIRATGRAYTGFLNRMRADVFDQLVRSQQAMGNDVKDPTFLKWAGKFVNAGTGRGGLGPLEKNASLLAQVFFSGRKMVATFEMLDPRMYITAPPAVRNEALKTAFAFLGGASAITGLAKFAGADVSLDPTSADFAKIKIGNTRFNLFGPYQQLFVLLARQVKGYGTSSTTGRRFTLGEGYKPVTRLDLLMRYFENKEHPTLSLGISGLRGQNQIGEPFDLPREALQRFLPMIIADSYSLLKEHGPMGLLGAVPTALGVPAQTYGGQELIQGKDQFNMETTQVTPRKELHQDILDRVLGPKPLETSTGSNVESYYNQLNQLPKEEAAKQFNQILETNPDLAKKILRVHKDRQMGVTVRDQELRSKGVASGDRARALAEEFMKAKSNEEKAKLWEHYVRVKIINEDVAKQVKYLINQQ